MTDINLVPGAGADPRKIIKPGKRLRNWHRGARAKDSTTPGLRAFVRAIAAEPQNSARRIVAGKWLASKKARSGV